MNSLNKGIFLLFLIGLLFYPNPMTGQYDKGWKANLGLSMINDIPVPGADFYTELIVPSFNIGYYLENPLSKKFVFRTSLDLDLIRSKETRNRGDVYNKYITYLSIPFLFETNSSGFNIGLGVRNSFKLFAGGKAKVVDDSNSEEIVTQYKFKSTEYTFHDLGPILNLSCHINKQIRIECQYYHGLKDIHSDKSVRSRVISWKTRQFLLGISVSLIKDKKRVRRR